MSARALEDFIKVIESCEGSSPSLVPPPPSHRSTRTSSSSLGYPTDIFSPYRRDLADKCRQPPSPVKNAVPKLWRGRGGDEFLGSSWGSVGAESSISAASSGKSQETKTGDTVRENLVSKGLSGAKGSPTKSASSSVAASPTKSFSKLSEQTASARSPTKSQNGEKDSPSSLNQNPLISLQRHSRHGRIQAKELSPASSPNASPLVKRKPRPKTMKTSPPEEERFEADSNTELPTPSKKLPKIDETEQEATPSANSRSESKLREQTSYDKPYASTSSEQSVIPQSSISSVRSSRDSFVSPSYSSPHTSVDSTESHTSSSLESTKKQSVIERVVRSPSPPESPRIPPDPLPRSKIIIRQSSVRMHVHVKKQEAAAKPAVEDKMPAKVPSPVEKRPKAKPTSSSRPKSAPPPRARKKIVPKPKPKPKVEPIVDLRSFSKSLKLLGCDIPSNRREATKLSHQELEVRTKSPTMRTRIKERTQSVTNLLEIIDSKETLPKKEYVEIKNPLAQAIYEEWYFRKAQEESRRRRDEEAAKEDEEYEKDQKKLEAEENFKDWLAKKKKLAKKKAAEEAAKKAAAEEKDAEEKKEKILRAEKEWREKKRKELLKAQRKKQKKLEQEEKEKEEKEKEKEAKKIDAEKAFKQWEKIRSDALKEKAKAEIERKKEEQKEKEEKEKERRELGEVFHKSWVKDKDEKLAETKTIVDNEQQVQKRQMRLKEAREAYEKWLDQIDLREADDKYMQEERAYRDMWRPPWYPGGKTENPST